MRLRGYILWITFLTLTMVCLIHIPIIHRYSPQLFLMETDMIKLTNKNQTSDHYRRRIPRIIHQTWKTSKIPRRWNRSVESVRKLNADHFQYRLWTDEDMYTFVRDKEPDFYKKTFLTYSYDIQRVDAFRYVLLYHLGGIYIDMDAGCSKSLNILLDVLEELDPQSMHLAALPATQPIGVSNDFMISTKGHPFFGQLISHLPLFNHNYILYYFTILISTGPLYVTFNERLFDTLSQEASLRIIEEKIYTPLFLWFAGGFSWHGQDALFFLNIYNFVRHPDPYIILPMLSAIIFLTIWLYLLFRRRYIFLRLR